jgi:RimJ/RimL family protein N-acetyltransferase
MHYLGIDGILDGYISGTIVAHPKPAPDVFLAAAAQLGVSPSECIVIEDSYNGVTAAAAAGIPSIGFLNPNSGNQDLSQAAILVEGFDEVDYHFIDMVYQHAYLQPATILTTDRLILRELAREDLEKLCEICNKPDINRYLTDYTGDVTTETAKLESYIKNIYHFYGYGLWGVYLKDTNRLIGRCGIEYKLLDQDSVYELGYLIDSDYQRKGYATEAITASIQYGLHKLGMDRILAIIEKSNVPSRELACKIGMKQNGEVIRNHREYFTYEIR